MRDRLALHAAILALVAVVLVPAPLGAAPNAWTEAWANLSKWTYITQDNCWKVQAHQAIGACQSAALQSVPTWDWRQPVSVEAAASGKPAAGSSTLDYFSGVALFQDDGTWAELATSRDEGESWIQAMSPEWFGIQPSIAGRSYRFRVAWSPRLESFTYSVNGSVKHTHPGLFSSPIRVWLVCASVPEATPDDGSAARCEFGTVTVTGRML